MVEEMEEKDLVKELIAFSAGIDPENLRGPVTLRFKKLENEKIAYIDEHRRIFFPQNFEAIPGKKSYVCYYYQTFTGLYTYKGEKHRVCRVYVSDSESKTPESGSDYRSWKDKSKNESPFAVLKNFNAKKRK